VVKPAWRGPPRLHIPLLVQEGARGWSSNRSADLRRVRSAAIRARRATGVVECAQFVGEGVKKWLSPPQRRRDAEKGPFLFKPLRLRDSAVKGSSAIISRRQ
jgi:hypothetical protein